jgi:chemotaxis protein methyltransferase CheR
MANEETFMEKNGREFHFTARDFERARRLIYDHAGISLSNSKQELVYSRLSRRLRTTGIPLVRGVPRSAGAGRCGRVGSVHQFADDQPDLVFP